MAERYNVIVPSKWKGKDGKENTKWIQVGSAWYREKLSGYSVHLDIPVAATDFLVVPANKERKGGGGDPAAGGDDGGDIPF